MRSVRFLDAVRHAHDRLSFGVEVDGKPDIPRILEIPFFPLVKNRNEASRLTRDRQHERNLATKGQLRALAPARITELGPRPKNILGHTFASPMAQSFWMAIFAFTGCFVGTMIISLATAPNRTDDELRGLVYSLTEKVRDDRNTPWYARPAALGGVVLTLTIGLNLIFW